MDKTLLPLLVVYFKIHGTSITNEKINYALLSDR